MKVLFTCATALVGSLHAQDAVKAPPTQDHHQTTESASKAAIYKSIVRIEVASQVPDYKTPWNAGRFSGGTGTGLLA